MWPFKKKIEVSTPADIAINIPKLMEDLRNAQDKAAKVLVLPIMTPKEVQQCIDKWIEKLPEALSFAIIDDSSMVYLWDQNLTPKKFQYAARAFADLMKAHFGIDVAISDDKYSGNIKIGIAVIQKLLDEKNGKDIQPYR